MEFYPHFMLAYIYLKQKKLIYKTVKFSDFLIWYSCHISNNSVITIYLWLDDFKI